MAIGGGWPEGFDPSLFSIQATLREGGDTAALQQALNAQLERLVRQGVTDIELRRAKNLVAADFWRGVSTIDGKARLLGEYAVMHGDHRLLFSAPAAYENVQRSQVEAVARAVFNPVRRTVGVLRPTAEPA